MKIVSGIAVAGLVTAALMIGSTESRGQECSHGPVHTIRVSEGADGNPVLKHNGVVNADVRVCMGNTVHWVLSGSNREFLVQFVSVSAFAGAKWRGSSNSAVQLVIGSPMERGQSYSYNVKFRNGGAADPHIIVD